MMRVIRTIAGTATAVAPAPVVTVEVIAFAPTEFFHCQHCEIVWNELGIGRRLHAEQRRAGLLPPELAAEYARIGDWVRGAAGRYGDRMRVRVVDAASIQGVVMTLRHRVRRFPSFVIDGRQRIAGFDQERLERAVAERLGVRTDQRLAGEGG